MFSPRVYVVAALFGVVLFTSFDRGTALACRVCTSVNDNNCREDPGKIAPTTCQSETSPSTTLSPTESSDASPDGAPVTTERATIVTSETTSIITERTTAVTTEGGTSRATSVSTPTTTASDSTVKSSTETASTSTEGTSRATSVSSPTTTTSDSTVESSTETASTSTDGTTTRPGNDTDSDKSDDETSDGSGEETKKPEGPQRVSRLGRDSTSFLRADADASFTCFKLVYAKDDGEIVERGCVEMENACEKLKTPAEKGEAGCYVCDNEDGCNSSSRIGLGSISVIVPVALVAIFGR